MSATIKGRAIKAFKAPTSPRFAATVDDAGMPNVVPLLSAKMIEPDRIAFVRFMIWKTKRNFEANKKITFACSGSGGRSYAAKGEFEKWVTQGPLLEKFENEAMYRYNAYTGANEVGVVRVKEVLDFQGTGLIRAALEAIKIKTRQDTAKGAMPAQVAEKFNRKLAVKFLGMMDNDGYPIAFPLSGLWAPDHDRLAFPMPDDHAHPLYRLAKGDPVAASVLAPDPVAYQVKGKFAGTDIISGKTTGAIEITEVYSAAPPVPGRRIFPPETFPDTP